MAPPVRTSARLAAQRAEEERREADMTEEKNRQDWLYTKFLLMAPEQAAARFRGCPGTVFDKLHDHILRPISALLVGKRLPSTMGRIPPGEYRFALRAQNEPCAPQYGLYVFRATCPGLAPQEKDTLDRYISWAVDPRELLMATLGVMVRSADFGAMLELPMFAIELTMSADGQTGAVFTKAELRNMEFSYQTIRGMVDACLDLMR